MRGTPAALLRLMNSLDGWSGRSGDPASRQNTRSCELYAAPQAYHLPGRVTITVSEAGRLLGIGRSAAYDAVRRGEIPGLRIGRRLLVPVPRLLALLGNDAARHMASTLDPSDRARKSPVFGLGADTIVLRGPAHPSMIEQLADRHFRQQYDDVTGKLSDVLLSGSAGVEVGSTNVRLYADQRLGVPEVRVEFSIPAMLNGHNRDPVDLNVLPDAVKAALDRISDEISGMPSLDQLRPTRLDIARNFQRVECPSRTLTAISQLRVQRGGADLIYVGRDGRVRTLMRGNTERWLIRGYDKHQEMLDRARKEPARRDLLAGDLPGADTSSWADRR